MCGKFTQGRTWREVHAFSQPLTVDASEAGEADTITIMGDAAVVCLNADRERIIASMVWGWPKSEKQPVRGGASLFMHAKSETIDQLPTFKDAFKYTRGFMWVQTFNVGEELPNGRVKQWVCERPDKQPMPLAAIYKECYTPEGEPYTGYVMVTTAANPQIAPLTDRMPAILSPLDCAMWIGEHPELSLETIKSILKPYPHELNIWAQATKAKPPKPSKAPEQPGLF